MQKKDFLYFLTDKNGKCYKLDSSGNVLLDVSVKPLPHTPDGWQDTMIDYTRNQTYFGMVRAFTEPLKFVTDGAEIVRFLFYSGGIQAECYLRIAKLNRLTGNHEKYFVGALDFSTFSDEREYVQVNILDSGLAAIIKANEGTTYQIPMGDDASDPVPVTDPTINVLLDGLDLQTIYSFASLNILHGTPGLTGVGTHWMDAIFVNVAGTQLGVKTQNVSFGPINDMSQVHISNNWFLQATQQVAFKINIEYDIDVFSVLGANSFAQIWLGNSSTPNAGLLSENLIANKPNAWINYKGTKDVDVSLNGGQNLYLLTEVWSGLPPGDNPTGLIIIRYNSITLTATAITKAPKSYCKALRPSFVFSRLIHKLSGLSSNSKSDLLAENDLETNQYMVLMTTGDAIRRIDGITMKLTFQDVFNAFNVLWNVGFGVENETGVLERRKYFYDDADILAVIDNISNLVVSTDNSDFFNDIQIGYSPQTYDNVNGKDEFNNTSEFSTPITRITNELNLVSPFRADMYGIEFTRIQTIGQDTTDTSSDDTIFFLVVEPKPYTDPESGQLYYKLYREPNVTITGLISPTTAFNIEISPKHLLMRHGNYIHAMLDKLDASNLIFQSASKNQGMAITYPADPYLIGSKPVTITENADVPISKLDYKLFLPYIFQFDTEIAEGVKNIFDANPKGLIQFNWNGNDYTGFIIECGIKPAFRESQSWKLLAAPNNDMSKLIMNG